MGMGDMDGGDEELCTSCIPARRKGSSNGASPALGKRWAT